MPGSPRLRGVPLAVYERLLEINAGFGQIDRAIAELAKSALFSRGELHRCANLAQEARAAISSYLAEAIEREETDCAGRLYRRRRTQERREEQG